MRLPKIRGLIFLLLVAGASYWLVEGWQEIMGGPLVEDRVVLSSSYDATFIYRDGSAEAMDGNEIVQHGGWWPITYGLPLGFLVLMSLASAWRMMFPKRYAIA